MTPFADFLNEDSPQEAVSGTQDESSKTKNHAHWQRVRARGRPGQAITIAGPGPLRASCGPFPGFFQGFWALCGPLSGSFRALSGLRVLS